MWKIDGVKEMEDVWRMMMRGEIHVLQDVKEFYLLHILYQIHVLSPSHPVADTCSISLTSCIEWWLEARMRKACHACTNWCVMSHANVCEGDRTCIWYRMWMYELMRHVTCECMYQVTCQQVTGWLVTWCIRMWHDACQVTWEWVIYESVMSHVNESYMKVSCDVWMSPVPRIRKNVSHKRPTHITNAWREWYDWFDTTSLSPPTSSIRHHSSDIAPLHSYMNIYLYIYIYNRYNI